jgi:hypothetical protein
MPHVTLDIERAGPIVRVGVGVSQARRDLLSAAGQNPPLLQSANALVDTGASSSAIDPSILSPLGLKPVSIAPVHTPSTGDQPAMAYIYDVSIWLVDSRTQYVLEKSFPVICTSLKTQGIDMLLGRDMLGECLLVYDGIDRRFTLAF